MTEKQLANYYLSFWNFDHNTKNFYLSSNTHADYHRFVNGLFKDSPTKSVREAMLFLATGRHSEVPGNQILLDWMQRYPKAIVEIDEVLKLKEPPKTLNKLLEKAYIQDINRNITEFRKFFEAKITSNT